MTDPTTPFLRTPDATSTSWQTTRWVCSPDLAPLGAVVLV
jgi:hypothetical protein